MFRTVIAAACLALAGSDAEAQMTEEKSDGLRVVYVDDGESFLVPHATRTTLNALAFQKALFGYEPPEELTVLLMDLADTGNGGASAVPHDTVRVQIAPLDLAFETMLANERMNTIMSHELVHVATMDQAAARDRRFRRVFGGKVAPIPAQPESLLYFYLTTPRVAAPRWYQEGIAVFVDTWMGGGLGRAQGGYDEMVFRTMVRDATPFRNPLSLVSEGTKVDFQLEINSYLYGTRFMTWLAYRYSPEHLIEWTARRDGSRAYYAAQFRHVFGVDLSDAWQEWIGEERTFQQANLQAIRRHPVTPFQDVTAQALGSVSRAYFDPETNRIYAAFNYPGVAAHVGAIDARAGSVRRLASIKGPVIYTVASVAWDPDERVLFYTTDNASWRDLVRLEVDTGQTQRLQEDARVGDIVFSRVERSLWGIRRSNGICSLVRIDRPYATSHEIASWPYGTVVYDLDVSPDGRMLAASFGEISGNHEVRLFDVDELRRGDLTPLARFSFDGSVPNGFSFAPDGRSLYGSSYFTGVSNVYRYDIAARTLESVTNSETGFFRPVATADGRLLVFRYTANGFVPAWVGGTSAAATGTITFLGQQLAALHPVVDTWNAGSPMAIDYESLPKQRRRYRIAGSLGAESLYPIVQGYKDTTALGVRVNVSDPVQLNRASVTASYSPDPRLAPNERLHIDADYERYDWRARASLNQASFYDLFGPTKTARKGYAVGIGRTQTIVFDEPRRLTLDLDVDLFGDLDRLPEYQNVAVDIRRLAVFDATLAFADIRNSLGSVDEESGTKWSVKGQGRHVDGAFITQIRGDFAGGIALQSKHSSVWFRQWAGFSPADRALPFANFYLGGFGNNYIDAGHEKRYREALTFPGAALNGISGRNFFKSMVELNLPPLRFASLGTPAIHAAWMRPALFATGMLTNVDAPSVRQRLVNVGAQIDLRLSFLSVLELTMSVGGAIACEAGRPVRRELMFSAKIL